LCWLFWDRVLYARVIWTTILFMLPHCNWDDRCVQPHPTIGWDRVSWTFPPGWPPTVISISCVAVITGMCPHIQLEYEFLNRIEQDLNSCTATFLSYNHGTVTNTLCTSIYSSLNSVMINHTFWVVVKIK
jgi:hypothetical protein